MRVWLTLLLVALLAARGGMSLAMGPGEHGGHLARAAASECPGQGTPDSPADHELADVTQCPLLSAVALMRSSAITLARFKPPRPAFAETRFASAEQPPRFRPPIS